MINDSTSSTKSDLDATVLAEITKISHAIYDKILYFNSLFSTTLNSQNLNMDLHI